MSDELTEACRLLGRLWGPGLGAVNARYSLVTGTWELHVSDRGRNGGLYRDAASPTALSAVKDGIAALMKEKQGSVANLRAELAEAESAVREAEALVTK